MTTERDDMTVEFLAYPPGHKEPVDFGTYATYVSLVAGCGTYVQSQSLPDYFQFDDPKTGNKTLVADKNWLTHDQEGEAPATPTHRSSNDSARGQATPPDQPHH